ncbi:MAG: hypothetical protein Q9167_001712 [Letrouitia subvulpina]
MPYGVSNSFKRGTVKTYTRPRIREYSYDEADHPHKKLCADDGDTAIDPYSGPIESQRINPSTRNNVPSSSTTASSPPPSDCPIFSDPRSTAHQTSNSPPSSPPPISSSPSTALKKPTISLLKRKRDHQALDLSKRPLTDLPQNVQRILRPRKKRKLTQMQIDLGGELHKTCKMCGMEYTPSNTEDSVLHRDFHSINVGGIDVGKAFSKDHGLKRVSPTGTYWLNDGAEILLVDRRSPLAARNKMKKVLEVVRVELGAAEISEQELWTGLEPTAPQDITRRKAKANGLDRREDRFRSFLYLKGEKCVGFCLAEKIGSAARVMDPFVDEGKQAIASPLSRSSSISVSLDADVVLLGISRIWTSNAHRKQGIATKLLETARSNFFYGMEVPKELIAFSQPTESGGQLARSWYDRTFGWHVYGEMYH